MIWNHSSRSELVVCGPGKIAGLDIPSGEELWKLPGFETFASSPTCDGDYLLFGNGGEGASGPLYGIRAGANGDLSLDPNNEKMVWKVNGAGTGWCSPVARNGLLFVPGKGLLSCYDSRDGKRLYRQRMPDMKTLTACPICTDEAVLFVDEEGTTFTIKVGPAFELLGSGKLEDTVWASPAASGKQLLIRGLKHLYCIRATNNP
ncbi:MAG: PQQ-binding-like beta-propeller repeat protein [Pirellula sp.]